MLEKINVALSFIRELANSQNLALHLSAATAFGCGLLLLWFGLNTWYLILSIVFVFSACMSIGLIIKNTIRWRQGKKKRKEDQLMGKLGRLGAHSYNHKEKNPWPDRNFKGLGWIICVNDTTRAAYLENPVCLECKTDLIIRTNSKCSGFRLECPDCKVRFEVDDIRETRGLAEASLQGDVRKNPQKYFLPYYL